MPESGYGNLVVLPPQFGPRQMGRSVFTDDELNVIPRPWRFLRTVRRLSEEEAEAFLTRTDEAVPAVPANAGRSGGRSAKAPAAADDLAFELEAETLPWEHCLPKRALTPAPGVTTLHVRLDDAVYFRREELGDALRLALIRLASFVNPAFLKAQAQRRAVWSGSAPLPRFLSYARVFPDAVSVPAGLLPAVRRLLEENGIPAAFEDARTEGAKLSVAFDGTLRPEQERILATVLRSERGIVIAPTGFGKTVFAMRLISERRVSTLILLNNRTLCGQWREAAKRFLGLDDDQVGEWCGPKRRQTRCVDVALYQSLRNLDDAEARAFLSGYGQVIVDECHHAGSGTFGNVLALSPSRFMLGLTETLRREDGLERGIRMLIGPVAARVKPSSAYPIYLDVLRSEPLTGVKTEAASHAELLNLLAADAERNRRLLERIRELARAGRRILVLTSRRDHQVLLARALEGETPNLFVLSSSLRDREREALMERLAALPESAPRLILATGQIAGEGFDHAPLDTLVLGLPIRGEQVLTQYVGRVLRLMTAKRSVILVDVVDAGLAMFERQWMRRQKFYRALGVVFGGDRETMMSGGTLFDEAPGALETGAPAQE